MSLDKRVIKILGDLGYEAEFHGVLTVRKDDCEIKIDDPEFYDMIEKLDAIDYFTDDAFSALRDYLEKYIKKYFAEEVGS